MPNFSKFIEKNALKIFIIVMILGIVARAVSFALLPEATYTDSVFHLSLVKEMLKTGSISAIQAIMPMPLYHFLLFVFFGLTGLPLAMPFVRIIPIVISALQIILAYLLCKELFPNRKELWFLGTAFTAAHAVLAIFSTVNLTEPIAAMFMLLSFWLLVRIKNSEKHADNYIVLFIFSVFLLSLAKLNATMSVPALIIGLIFVLKEKKVSVPKIAFITGLIVLLCASWFIFNFFTIGNPLGFSMSETEDLNASLFETRITLERAGFFYFNFWYFPNPLEFPKIGISDPFLISLSMAIFFAAMLPLVFLILAGIHQTLREQKIIYITMFLAILFCFPIVVKRGFDARLFVPVLPLFGILAAYSFSLLKGKNLKALAVLSVLFFGIFSFAYVAGSAYYFDKQYEKVSGLYSFISKLPGDSKILSESEFRRISFYTDKNARPVDDLGSFTEEPQFLSAFKSSNFTHFAVSCTDEYPPNKTLVNSLAAKKTLELVYSDSCSSLYKINYG